MNEHGHCPKCNADLDGGSIWEHFFRSFKDEKKADEIAEMYGATREKGRWGRAIALYSRDEDRTVAYKCPDCKHEWSR